MEQEFKTLTELYDRVKPALFAKKREMRREGHLYISEVDIWNYFKEKKWQQTKNLSLHDMVNDILNSDNYEIDIYFKKKLNQQKRVPNLE